MDVVGRARRLLQAVAEGGDVGTFLHPHLSFRSDDGDVLGRDGALGRLAGRLGGGHRLVEADLMARRNVVIASWRRLAPDGAAAASGTWILSLDRDGLVTDWVEIVAEEATGIP